MKEFLFCQGENKQANRSGFQAVAVRAVPEPRRQVWAGNVNHPRREDAGWAAGDAGQGTGGVQTPGQAQGGSQDGLKSTPSTPKDPAGPYGKVAQPACCPPALR